MIAIRILKFWIMLLVIDSWTSTCFIDISSPLHNRKSLTFIGQAILWIGAPREPRSWAVRPEISSCWAGAARQETAWGAVTGTRWDWAAIAVSASAPDATRTGTVTPLDKTRVSLASAPPAAGEDEQTDDDSLSQLYYSLCNNSWYVIVLTTACHSSTIPYATIADM
jgi:hypothetical protein